MAKRTLSDKYRTDSFPEYDKLSGKLKPVGRWIGVSPAAKKLAKKGTRRDYAATPQIPIVEKELESAAQAQQSRIIRGLEISKHNHERAKHERDLRLGMTDAQRKLRAQFPDIPAEERTYEQGGEIDTYFGRVSNPGYLGVELRAIRREHGVGRPVR